MPTCASCKTQWSFFTAVKRTLTMNAGMDCPHCSEPQYIRHENRRFLVPVLILSILPILLFTVPMTLQLFLIIFTILSLIAFLYMVVSIKLTNLEDGNSY